MDRFLSKQTLREWQRKPRTFVENSIDDVRDMSQKSKVAMFLTIAVITAVTSFIILLIISK